jgi:hypothetical protein
VLGPPPGARLHGLPRGWIDFDDVIEKIGWTPRSTKERREMHARIWEFIQFGERAVIVGRRSTPYKDPHTRKEIDTEVSTSVRRVMQRRDAAQGSLPLGGDAPVAAEIAISSTIAQLIQSPHTAQFLPMGEVLGALPGGKPAGAWARVIGLALMNFWRR